MTAERLDWVGAWRALPARDRRRIARTVRRGARLVLPAEAALAAWFALRELQRWPRFVLLLAAVALWPMLTRVLPVDPGVIAYVWAGGIVALPMLVWLYLTTYRPGLRRAMHDNLAVAAGIPPRGAPDPRAAAALMHLIEREGWLRTLQHQRRRGL